MGPEILKGEGREERAFANSSTSRFSKAFSFLSSLVFCRRVSIVGWLGLVSRNSMWPIVELFQNSCTFMIHSMLYVQPLVLLTTQEAVDMTARECHILNLLTQDLLHELPEILKLCLALFHLFSSPPHSLVAPGSP